MSEQEFRVLLRPDTSTLEAKIDALALEVREAISYMKGESRPSSYTPRQFAAMLQVNVRRIYDGIRQGRIHAVQVGGQYRIPRLWADNCVAGTGAGYPLGREKEA